MSKLTTGTITSPASIQKAPALIGDCSTTGNQSFATIFASITIVENTKFTHTAGLVTRFQYRLYKNGARNAPARAPHEMPISCAMKVTLELYWISAKITEIRINTTISKRIMSSCFFSLSFFTIVPFMKSSVKVELDAKTKEDKVDIDADSTSTTTTAISNGDRSDSMAGIMGSVFAPSLVWEISDFTVSVMAIINTTCVILLWREVRASTDEYFV